MSSALSCRLATLGTSHFKRAYLHGSVEEEDEVVFSDFLLHQIKTNRITSQKM
jgi:hypothetical protein